MMDFMFGTFLGIGVGLLMATAYSEVGLNECERDLPRTQQCVEKWIKP